MIMKLRFLRMMYVRKPYVVPPMLLFLLQLVTSWQNGKPSPMPPNFGAAMSKLASGLGCLAIFQTGGHLYTLTVRDPTVEALHSHRLPICSCISWSLLVLWCAYIVGQARSQVITVVGESSVSFGTWRACRRWLTKKPFPYMECMSAGGSNFRYAQLCLKYT